MADRFILWLLLLIAGLPMTTVGDELSTNSPFFEGSEFFVHMANGPERPHPISRGYIIETGPADEKRGWIQGVHMYLYRDDVVDAYQVSFPPMPLGAILPVQGRTFRLDKIVGNPQRRPELTFKAHPLPEFEKKMSPARDTHFLPIDGRVRHRGFDFKLTVDEPLRSPMYHSAPKVLIRISPTRILTGPGTADPTKEQMRQELGIGDVFWCGKYGLKIHNIVLPQRDEKITGWIEVYQKEVLAD